MEKKIVVPYAPILVESTRSIGYSFEAAVADIIDNRISATATEIRVCFSSQNPQWLCIEDNGWGMTAAELETAMRYGSQSSHDVRRKDDLRRVLSRCILNILCFFKTIKDYNCHTPQEYC